MGRTEIGRISVTVSVDKRVPTADGHGYTHRSVGTRTAVCAVVVDLDRLRYMAVKAARSKSGKAGALHGALAVRVVRSEEHPIKKESP